MKAITTALVSGVLFTATFFAVRGRAAPRRLRRPGPEFYSPSCRPEDFEGRESARVRAGYAALRPYLDLVANIVGPVTARSWWRPPDCNARGSSPGASRSRHLEGWAVDARLESAQTRALVGAIRRAGAGALDAGAWGNHVRRALGTSRKVGLRIYPTGNLHIDLGCPAGGELCDPRSGDWLDIAEGWR